MSIGQIITFSLQPVMRKIRRYVIGLRVRMISRDLDQIERDIENAFAAQRYLHAEQVRAVSELNLL